MLGVDPFVKKMIRHFSEGYGFFGHITCRHTDHTVTSHQTKIVSEKIGVGGQSFSKMKRPGKGEDTLQFQGGPRVMVFSGEWAARVWKPEQPSKIFIV